MLPRTTTIHKLKTVQPYFDDIWLNGKTFEVRKNDRDFKINDIVMLLEYDPNDKTNPKTCGYTGKCITGKITYILDDPKYCKEGYIIFAFQRQELIK